MDESQGARITNRQEGWGSNKDLSTSFASPVTIPTGHATLEGNLTIPKNATGLVIFVHGSGSSRNSPRNQYVAGELQQAGLATLLFDLLTPEEEQMDLRTRHLRFDIDLLARRTIEAADWLARQPEAKGLCFGFFGASTGAAAALIAAAERQDMTGAVVSRGGRPDLASGALHKVKAPVLLLVGQFDKAVAELNLLAQQELTSAERVEVNVISGAAHLFEEPGALDAVARQAAGWFTTHMAPQENTGPGDRGRTPG